MKIESSYAVIHHNRLVPLYSAQPVNRATLKK